MAVHGNGSTSIAVAVCVHTVQDNVHMQCTGVPKRCTTRLYIIVQSRSITPLTPQYMHYMTITPITVILVVLSAVVIRVSTNLLKFSSYLL
jgi:hypothetical protein